MIDQYTLDQQAKFGKCACACGCEQVPEHADTDLCHDCSSSDNAIHQND